MAVRLRPRPPALDTRFTGADAEAAHQQLGRLLQHVPHLALPLLHQLLVCLTRSKSLHFSSPLDSSIRKKITTQPEARTDNLGVAPGSEETL